MNESGTEVKLPPIAVLCGGLATRLWPLTEKIPKSMIEIAGEPFIAWQLRLLATAGFRNVVLLCGYLGEQIEQFVGDGQKFGLKVRYCHDGDNPLGTGGAVRRALPILGSTFMTIYGDSYCPTDYRRIYSAYLSSGKAALMTVFRNENKWDKSNVEYRNGCIVRYDKKNADEAMTYIDYGVNVFTDSVFAVMPENEAFDLAVIQTDLARKGNLAGIEVSERFFEVGSHGGIDDFRAFVPNAAEMDAPKTPTKEGKELG
jgi:NDP-sugar pyrophosphorylase family protein